MSIISYPAPEYFSLRVYYMIVVEIVAVIERGGGMNAGASWAGGGVHIDSIIITTVVIFSVGVSKRHSPLIP